MSPKSPSHQQGEEPSHQQSEQLERPRVEAMEAILGKPFPVLDDGFIRVIDYMGNDHSVVQAARVSYGKGTKKVHQDRGLIRYLMRHRHTTPFEMCEIKLHVRVPMDTWRQWIRHRTACLPGDTVLSFDEPEAIKRGCRKHLGKTIKELYDQWHNRGTQTDGQGKTPGFIERIDPQRKYTIPELARLVEHREEDLCTWIRKGKLAAERIPQSNSPQPAIFVKGSDWIDYANKQLETVAPLRSKIKQMRLRMCDEQTGEILHTHITDIWESGIKPVFKVTLENGYSLKMSKDHLCLTEQGWLTLEQATGLKLSGTGEVIWKGDSPGFAVNGIPMPRSREWLSQQRQKRAEVVDIAAGKLNKLFRYYSKVVRIEYAGEEMTYDLSVEGPYHNFVANGFIVHNSVNEYSTRYSIAIDAAQTTSPEQWRRQATGNRQGSAGFLDSKEGEKLTRREAELQRLAREVYEERLEAGVAREQARKDLPLSTYTEAYWKIDLHNLLHFLELRMAPNAQYEIRCYAEIIGREILSRWCPLVWEAFCDYRLNSLSLSGPEIEIIQNIAGGKPEDAIQTAVRYGWLPGDRSAPIKRHREREECEEKLRRLNLSIPWLPEEQ